MPLVNMKDMLHHAYTNGYAVGAIDVVSIDLLHGVMEAAEKCRAPLIIGLAEPHLDHYDLALLAPAAEAAARRSSVPVALHFDHGSGVEAISLGMRHGCNGVMVDASHLPLHDNIAQTSAVVQLAHCCGVPVEAELGYVPDSGGELVFTTPEEARGFVRVTGVDFLAVSIGTTHGRLTGKPNLDYPRLRQINEALKIPLVLHGSSGLSDDHYRRLIANGIAKINHFTALTDLAAQQVIENAVHDGGYLSLFAGVRQKVAQETERLMRVWGSAGRAAEVLAQCHPWPRVEHQICFTLPEADAAETAIILERGARVLRRIPGVRDVVSGAVQGEGGSLRQCWHLHLVSESVVEQMRSDGEFQAFAKRYLEGYAKQVEHLTFSEQ